MAKRPLHLCPTLPDAVTCERRCCPRVGAASIFFFFVSRLGRFALNRGDSRQLGLYRVKPPIQAEIKKKKKCKTHRSSLQFNLSQFSKRTYATFFTSIFSSLSLSVLCLPSRLSALRLPSLTDALKLTSFWFPEEQS